MTYRYGGPFTDTFGSSTSPLYSFTENGNQTTQLQISAASDNTLVRYNKATDGQIGQFGFKVCESDDGLAYAGLVCRFCAREPDQTVEEGSLILTTVFLCSPTLRTACTDT